MKLETALEAMLSGHRVLWVVQHQAQAQFAYVTSQTLLHDSGFRDHEARRETLTITERCGGVIKFITEPHALLTVIRSDWDFTNSRHPDLIKINSREKRI